MAKRNHTKAGALPPLTRWRALKDATVETADGQTFICVCGDPDKDPGKGDLARARFIASLPQLYETLNRIACHDSADADELAAMARQVLADVDGEAQS